MKRATPDQSNFPQIPFAEHMRDMHRNWEQGEHVLIAAPSKSGKTTLAKSLLERRSHVVGFGVKPYDETLRKDFSEYSFVQKWSEIEGWMSKVIIWPRPKRKESTAEFNARQRAIFQEAFDKLIRARNWCVFIDEGVYMSDAKFGNVGRQIEQLHYIGRSSGTSVVTLAQRPAFIPLAVISNASHAYIARTKLASDVKRLSDLGDVDPKELGRVLSALPSRHDFVYTPTQGEGRSGIINTRR